MELTPNRLLAAATIDRLRHNAYRVTLDGPSFRGERETKKQKIIGYNLRKSDDV